MTTAGGNHSLISKIIRLDVFISIKSIILDRIRVLHVKFQRMYESSKYPPLARIQFLKRMLAHFAATLGLIIASLIFGMTGYVVFEHLTLIDAYINATMLLGGMGPVNAPVTTAGKLFAGFYALYSGLIFIVAAALIFTPVLHRLIHRFHWDEK